MRDAILAADALFSSGDYAGAKAAYLTLSADASLTAEERAHVEQRLRALSVDRVTIAFAAITAAVVVFVYLWSHK